MQAFEHLPDNSLAKNMRRTFGRIALILLLIGVLGAGSLIYSNSATSDLLNRVEPLISYNDEMLVQVLEMNTDVRNYLRTGESSYIGLYRTDKQSYQQIFQNAFDLLSSSEMASNVLQNENSSAKSLFSSYELTALAVPPSQLSSQRIDEVLFSVNQHLQSYRSSYKTANTFLTTERKTAQHRLGILVLITTAITITAVLFAIIMGFRRAIIARLRIQEMVGRITDTLSRLEAGEAGVRAPLTGLLEERILASAINSMAEQKEALIDELETEYDKEKQKLGMHCALGGGNLAIFGTPAFYTFSPSIESIPIYFNDNSIVDTTVLPDDSNRRKTYWANYSTQMGAIIHEIGHCFGSPHDARQYTRDAIMNRGFDYMNRFFMAKERLQDGPIHLVLELHTLTT